MGARRLKSTHVSDTSGSPRPDPLTFVVDICLGKNLVAALRSRGVDARFLTDCGFQDAERDEVWMPAVAANGWVALTRDQAIRRRAPQQAAVRRSKLRLFLLQTQKPNKRVIEDVFTRHWERIEQLSRERPGPFIAGVSQEKVELLAMNRARRGGH